MNALWPLQCAKYLILRNAVFFCMYPRKWQSCGSTPEMVGYRRRQRRDIVSELPKRHSIAAQSKIIAA